MGIKVNRLSQFAGQNYLNLETFRKIGARVQTPAWFVQDGEILYVRTGNQSSKVRRIQHNSQVRILPSDRNFKQLGVWMIPRLT